MDLHVKVKGVQEVAKLADELFIKARAMRSDIGKLEQALLDLGITIEKPEEAPPAKEQAMD